MQLTPLEYEIVAHRLTVPECIAECLPDYHPEDVADCCESLLDVLRCGLKLDAASLLVRDVLIDCVEGSTYCGCANGGGVSAQKLAAIHRAAESLARKVAKFTGRKLEAVLH
jgi:hypothetical protein